MKIHIFFFFFILTICAFAIYPAFFYESEPRRFAFGTADPTNRLFCFFDQKVASRISKGELRLQDVPKWTAPFSQVLIQGKESNLGEILTRIRKKYVGKIAIDAPLGTPPKAFVFEYINGLPSKSFDTIFAMIEEKENAHKFIENAAKKKCTYLTIRDERTHDIIGFLATIDLRNSHRELSEKCSIFIMARMYGLMPNAIFIDYAYKNEPESIRKMFDVAREMYKQ